MTRKGSLEKTGLERSGSAVLSVDEHARADAAAADAGTPVADLMEAAGAAVAREVRSRWPDGPVRVLCGPGDNGGDGFVAARVLAAEGRDVTVLALVEAQKSPASAQAAARYSGPKRLLDDKVSGAGVVVDALFGAGLSRPLEGAAAAWAAAEFDAPVLAVDVPSGVIGNTGGVDGPAFQADATVTFFRKKPAHLLDPGLGLCGDVVVADIGHPEAVWDGLAPTTFENGPALWAGALRWPGRGAHKHARGRLSVVTGGPANTGAARLAARAGLRAGAGLVTLEAPADALLVVAAASTAVMTRGFKDAGALARHVADQTAVVLGPAAGVTPETRAAVEKLATGEAPLILDADALSVFAERPEDLFALLRAGDVVTPHRGEFRRLFPDLANADALSAARQAAARAGCVVLLKGASTVVAAPDGRAAINTHASPFLATAGTGDVLAGVVGGLVAQGVPAFDAACAAAWIHGDASLALGPGLIAEDLVEALPIALRRLYDARPAARPGA